MLLFLRSFFVVKGIRLIWFDRFLEQVNRKDESHAEGTNRHILEQVNHEKKKKKQTVNFQFTNKESMVNHSKTSLSTVSKAKQPFANFAISQNFFTSCCWR